MDRREKIGLGVVALLLAFFIAVLAWTFGGSGSKSHDYSESIFTKQRIINLNK